MSALTSITRMITPDWPAPPSIGAAMSTRLGGVSTGPYASLNLRPSGGAIGLNASDPGGAIRPNASGGAVGLDAPGSPGDDPTALAENLRRFEAALGVRPVFLRQVHGTVVVNLDEGAPALPTADAAVTTRIGVACTVMVADCLPVLFTDRQGLAVGAAHAGWRGLVAGVLEATLEALCRAAQCPASQVLAWLGPCIGPQAFEVGADVRDAFGDEAEHRFRSKSQGVGQPGEDVPKWFADLAGLAQDRLHRLGVGSVTPSYLCTVSDPSRFFSFRRDGLTGRMAASIWRRG